MAVITLKNGQVVEGSVNQRLVLALMENDVDILHRCGGNARCTTCRVRFIEGEPERMTQAEKDRLEARGLLGEARLSCQILCNHDMKIEVLQTLAGSDLEDAGPRPADNITPEPVWIKRP